MSDATLLKSKVVSVSIATEAVPFEVVGASLTAVTVIFTVPAALSTVPSLALKVKLSVPL